LIIKILGTGCANCKKLEQNALAAVRESGSQATLEKVEDIRAIARHGVMKTPALVIDDEVRSVGKVLSVEEIKALII